uniref:AP2/ERF domain-containing protein n=1 Tax=Chloropicon primus TaxID=1764295 RepID=A0A7S2T5S2_9CHLO|mmetsp:Transcript_8316/g.23796  ORF Transcript_8316/g.23796 Transcript_8316/m.23796 type:complete len:246 (+) Transcript_8316:228-965(+)
MVEEGRTASETEEGMEVPQGVRGVYKMRTAKEGVSRYQVRIWIKRGQVGGEGESPATTTTGKKRRKKVEKGRRVHLGCFNSLETSIHAFDVGQIFFAGSAAATNRPASKYARSPVLEFLLREVQDRSNLDEFMTVWKHLMQHRWLFDHTEPDPKVTEQLNLIKSKVGKYKARSSARPAREKTEDIESTSMPQLTAPSGPPIPAQPNLSDFLQQLVQEKQQQEMLALKALLDHLPQETLQHLKKSL